MKSSTELEQGATVVITHRVREGDQHSYESWLNEIVPLCKSYPGNLDLQIIRPIAGLTTTYTIIIRFATVEQLHNWMGSADRQHLIGKVRPLLVADDAFAVRSGLEFWFPIEGSPSKGPVRWKQFLVTWSAICPLALVVPLVVAPVLNRLGISGNRYLSTLSITGTVVFLMTYVVMPRYTRLIKRWLFK